MGGPNLEVFKFGMYIMFPIGIMYYFGTNLDSRFSVPDFWPKQDQTHKIPHDWEDIDKEIARLRERRLAARDRRLEVERQEAVENGDTSLVNAKPEVLEAIKMKEAELREGTGKVGWFR